MAKVKMRTKNYILSLAVLLCLVSTIMMIVVLCTPKEEMGIFVPPAFDSSAVVGAPVVHDDLGWQELDAQAYKVGICGKVIPKDSIADIWLTNPDSNTVWLKVRVLDEKGNILGETGIIKQGEYVQSVNLNTVPKAGTPIVLKIMAYQPDTYYSEGSVSLNTTIGDDL